jgi:tetratricopeptide (TPR) repeat protein
MNELIPHSNGKASNGFLNMNDFKITTKRDRDLTWITRPLYCFLLVLAALVIICMSTGAQLFTFKHVLIYSLCSIPLCFLYAYCVEKIGSVLGTAPLGLGSRRSSPREIFVADLEIARQNKRNGKFEEARSTIDGVLDKDREFPDALYLKAEILWEGFENASEAKRCLRKVMQLVPREETLHSWASSFFDKIIAAEKKQSTHGHPNKESGTL